MIWACVMTKYQQTSKEDKKLKLERFKKRVRKTEVDLEDMNGKGTKGLNLQIEN